MYSEKQAFTLPMISIYTCTCTYTVVIVHSLVSRPRPAFCCLQYGKPERAVLYDSDGSWAGAGNMVNCTSMRAMSDIA